MSSDATSSAQVMSEYLAKAIDTDKVEVSQCLPFLAIFRGLAGFGTTQVVLA